MISDNLLKLKRAVEELVYTGDDIAFDQALSAVDLIIFDLRTECFVMPMHRPKAGRTVINMNWNELLDDISSGLEQPLHGDKNGETGA